MADYADPSSTALDLHHAKTLLLRTELPLPQKVREEMCALLDALERFENAPDRSLTATAELLHAYRQTLFVLAHPTRRRNQ